MVHLGVIWGLSEDYLKFSGNLMEFLRFPHESGTLTQRGEVCGCLENPGFIHCQQHGFVILDSRPCVFSVWWFPGWTVGKVQFAYIISVMVVCSSNIHFSRRLHVTRLFSKTLLENDFRHLWTLLRLKSGWWFGTFFYFSIYWESSSQLTFIFSEGLKPQLTVPNTMFLCWRQAGGTLAAVVQKWRPEATPGERMIKIYHIIYSFTGILRYRMI